MYWINHTYQNFIPCRYSSCGLIGSLCNWVIQLRREPRGSLVQDGPDGPRKHNCESIPRCSRLYPAESWKPPSMENVWLILANTSTASCCETGFLYLQIEFLLVSFISIFSFPSVMHHWGAWLHLLSNLLVGAARPVLRLPQSCSFSRLNKPSSLSFSSLAKCSSLQPSWWPSAELGSLYSMSFLYWWYQNWGQYLYVV